MARKRSLRTILRDARACRTCEAHLEPRPILQAGSDARLVIIGQAPGRKVHDNGVPWDDVSGRRLRECRKTFRRRNVARSHQGCAPSDGVLFSGMGKSGDLPPRRECAPQWHPSLLDAMPSLKLTLLLGLYAQQHYLRPKAAVTVQVQQWKKDLRTGKVALPHPSPRSRWTRVNPWFEKDVLPAIRRGREESAQGLKRSLDAASKRRWGDWH